MSCSRRCDIWKANDGHYYVTVGDFEHAHDDSDCSSYGPFNDEDGAYDYARSTGGNPGGYMLDESGTQPPPAEYTRPRGGRSIW